MINLKIKKQSINQSNNKQTREGLNISVFCFFFIIIIFLNIFLIYISFQTLVINATYGKNMSKSGTCSVKTDKTKTHKGHMVGK